MIIYHKIQIRLDKYYDTELYIYGALDHYAKRICDSNVLSLEENLEERLQALTFENIGTVEEISGILVNYLNSCCVLYNLRGDFFKTYLCKDSQKVAFFSLS
jgi:hypothetical protein